MPKTTSRCPSRFPLMALCVALLAGCATVSARHEGTPLDEAGKLSQSSRTKSGLRISGQELDDLASQYFGAVRVTFENPSSHWVNIKRMAVSFGTETRNSSVLLPYGTQIDSWMEATARRNAVRQVNQATGLTLLQIAGTTAAIASGKSSLGKAGALIAGGAVAVSTAEAIAQPIEAANTAPLFPQSHLLSVPFEIPPGLFADKWVLLQTPDPGKAGCIRSIILDYETEAGGRERVVLPFRNSQEISEWQGRVCASAPRPVTRQ